MLRAPEPLRSFNDIGVLSAADVHVARALTELAGEGDGSVKLAVALAVRAPRLGHIFVDLATVRDTAAIESDEVVDLSGLPWPEADAWTAVVAGSCRLVAVGEEPLGAPRPLRLIGTRLYLDRYWREERQVAADLVSGAVRSPGVDAARLAQGISRLFAGGDGGDDHLQRCAAACAVLRRLSVIAGGPGTGKTTTVARIAALLYEQAVAAGRAFPLIALTAPTGKASARLQESVRFESARLRVEPLVRTGLLELRASTIHRLLGSRGSYSHFRHDRSNSLPHDVVIVDETSMVSLELMARLLEAVRPDARVVLLGDPGQLTAIEAGAVLRDIVGPAADGLRMSASMRAALTTAVGSEVMGLEPPAGVTFGDGIVVLERVHRFGEGIAAVADAIRRGDGEGVVEALRSAPDSEVTWIAADSAGGGGGGLGAPDPDAQAALGPVRGGAVGAAQSVILSARDGDAAAALRALSAFRVLCAHRRGPHGVARWTEQIERWLAAEVDGFDAAERDYIGRPLLITHNDYELGLYNGDTGVIVREDPDRYRVSAVFERGRELVAFTPTRLAAVETVYAMTIHKSQGSQFDTAAVLLPDVRSRILTRELLYTAVTRARRRLILVGTEEMVRAAVKRPVARASGLGERLWAA
ncbi:MAG: exodeoxyribonuclease V subunit alpha [Actinomycetota bacterium]|nr:exodeoxyribonuclease V subunit alpha [Actinomycetota bacterium]